MKAIEKIIQWFCPNCQTPQSKKVMLDTFINEVQEEIFECKKCKSHHFLKIDKNGSATFSLKNKEIIERNSNE